ncbi:uncharacterized protein PpBr36_09853 [Pyricularia pennisetigena]|uniref:uncharacterized protein n=1 Tax=Pyricularia pennisetigena TaxID=1578925 RepID=UPI0011516188|nr:uncharacterized protein PpBr36_09853 [Pyricularia pennisetigena]TLS22275.1 hypothetical protein PpBr36_09853 [Pyricularia pennisetigena]
MERHPLQSNQSLIASLRSLTEYEKWPEFDALEAEFNRCFDAGSEDARQVREHESLVQAMRAAEAGVHRALETKTRWAAVEMARVKRVQIQADALMAEAKVMQDEAGREMKRARAVEDEGETEISRHEEVVASIKGRLGRITREREGRRVAHERRFKAAVGRLWQTVEDVQGVRPVAGEAPAQGPAPLLLSTPFSHKKPGSTNPKALSISQLLINTKEEPSSATSHPCSPPLWERTQLPTPESRGPFCWPAPHRGPNASPQPRNELSPLGSARSDAKPSCLVTHLNYTTWHQHQPMHPQSQQETTQRKRRAVECAPKPDSTPALAVPQLAIPSGASTRSFSPASCSPLSTTSSLSHIPTALRLPPPTRSFPGAIQLSPTHFPPHAPTPARPTTGQVPFKHRHNTIPPPPLSHRKPKPLTTTAGNETETTENWDTSFLTPEPGLLGSVSWEQFHSDRSKYPLYKRWLCQRRQRVRGVRGMRGPPRWLVFKCPAHPAHVIDSQKELERHYRRDHVDVKTSAQRLRECGVHVRGCRLALASSHNARITRDTYAVDWGSEEAVSGGGGGDERKGGGVREQVVRAVSEPGGAWSRGE